MNHYPSPEISKTYSVIPCDGKTIIKITFKPQYVITGKDGKPVFASNSLAAAKAYIKKSS